MENSKQILSLMIRAAKSSGDIIRNNFRQDSHSEQKTSHLDIVTATDRLSQQNIHNLLIHGMVKLEFDQTEIGFVEEESSTDNLKKHNFIVDPLDGTTNFASGIPFCCISIAYAQDQKISLGVVYEPFSDTLYWGQEGAGAFIDHQLTGKRKLALYSKPIKSWIVGAHLNSLDVVSAQFAQYQKIYPHVRGLRNLGSLTLDLCFMADNIIDVVFNQGCYFWDLAATSVILHEAAGEIYNDHGQILEFDWQDTKKKYHILACHPDSKPDVLLLTRD